MGDLICSGLAEWNIDLIVDLFEEASASAILQLPTPRQFGADEALWLPSPDRIFSIKQVYLEVIKDWAPHLAILSPTDRRQFWRLKIVDRLQHFLWRVIWNSLHTWSLLAFQAGVAPKFQHLSTVWSS